MIITLAAMALGGQPVEPDDDAWDMTHHADHGRVASAAWASGQALLVRCKDGRLDVIVNGLPPASSRSRRIEMTLGEVGPETQTWATTPSARFASPPEPARIARLLADGGELKLNTAGGEEKQTYALPLPTNGDGIRQVLRDCNQPLQGEHDRLARLTGDAITWRRVPALVPPREGVPGEAVVGCIVDTLGRPASCWIEAESPTGKGIGAAALGAARKGLLDVPDDGRDGVRLIRFTTRYNFD